MRVSIKSKLVAGFVFLFAVILTVVVLSVIFVNRMSGDTKAILENNFNSLTYCNEMLKALDSFKQNPNAPAIFELNLEKQEKNVTEKGEKEATRKLRYYFEEVKKNTADTTFLDDTRKEIYLITELNSKAVGQKNQLARQTSSTATTWLAIVGSVLTLITFSFIIYFPGFIANPVKVLTAGIKEIANKNYSKRIYFDSHDEFGELAEAFNLMASRLDDYEHSNLAKLMFEKKRIETIIGQMNDAIIGLDSEKNILFINSIAESLLSMKAPDVIGKYSADVALRNDLFRNLLLKEEKSNQLKIVIDGKENFFNKEYKNVMNENEIIGQVIVLKNITQFKELDVSKTNFIATISHELKTPISSIKMSLKLLNDARVGNVNEEQNHLINNIGEDTERLLKIIGELLDLTQIESGKIHLQQQKVSPMQIVETSVKATEFQAKQKNVTIEVQSSDPLPKIEVDSEKTSWVLINLIANAIRYTPQNNKVIISVKFNNHNVTFSVQDFGKGIDEKYKQELFTRYFRVPDANEHIGSGLGLAISKEFIEAQGGKISVESKPGEGSTFSFMFNAKESYY